MKDMRRCLLPAAIVLAFCAACNRPPAPEKVAAPEDVEFAKKYLALFQSRSFAAIEMGTDPSARDAQFRAKMIQIAAMFPQTPPRAVRLVEAARAQSGRAVLTTLALEYEYPNRVLLANVGLLRQDQATLVKSVQVLPLKDTLERLNRFTLRGKTVRHYAVLGSAVAVLLFVLFAFVTALRTPIPGPKWAWLAFILLGFVHVGINWTTGVMFVKPTGIQALASGFSRPSPFAPLLIWTSIPAGAIVFFVQRREWREESAAEEPGEPTPPAAPHGEA